MARSAAASGAARKSPRSGSKRCRSRATASSVSARSSRRSGWRPASRARSGRAGPAPPPPMSVTPRPSLATFTAFAHRTLRALGFERPPASGEHDAEAAEVMQHAQEARRAGRLDEARTLFRHVVQRWPAHRGALHELRDLAVDARQWDDAIAVQQQLMALAPPADRAAEAAWLAVEYYELGRLELARGAATSAVGHFKAALRADPKFTPAVVALGDAYEAVGDPREA